VKPASARKDHLISVRIDGEMLAWLEKKARVIERDTGVAVAPGQMILLLLAQMQRIERARSPSNGAKRLRSPRSKGASTT